MRFSALTANAAGSSPCTASQAMVPAGYIEGFHGFLSIRMEFSHLGIPCPKCCPPTCVIIHFGDLTLHYLQVNLMFKRRQSTYHMNNYTLNKMKLFWEYLTSGKLCLFYPVLSENQLALHDVCKINTSKSMFVPKFLESLESHNVLRQKVMQVHRTGTTKKEWGSPGCISTTQFCIPNNNIPIPWFSMFLLTHVFAHMICFSC